MAPCGCTDWRRHRRQRPMYGSLARLPALQRKPPTAGPIGTQLSSSFHAPPWLFSLVGALLARIDLPINNTRRFAKPVFSRSPRLIKTPNRIRGIKGFHIGIARPIFPAANRGVL